MAWWEPWHTPRASQRPPVEYGRDVFGTSHWVIRERFVGGLRWHVALGAFSMGAPSSRWLCGTSSGSVGGGPTEYAPVGPSSTRGWFTGCKAGFDPYGGGGGGVAEGGAAGPLVVVGCGSGGNSGLWAFGRRLGTYGCAGGGLPCGMWVLGIEPAALLGTPHGTIEGCGLFGFASLTLKSSLSMSYTEGC